MGRSQLLFAAFLTFLALARIANAEAGLYLAINPLAFTEGGTADGEVVEFDKTRKYVLFPHVTQKVTYFFCLIRW